MILQDVVVRRIRQVELQLNVTIPAEPILDCFDDLNFEVKPLQTVLVDASRVIIPHVNEVDDHGEEGRQAEGDEDKEVEPVERILTHHYPVIEVDRLALVIEEGAIDAPDAFSVRPPIHSVVGVGVLQPVRQWL